MYGTFGEEWLHIHDTGHGTRTAVVCRTVIVALRPDLVLFAKSRRSPPNMSYSTVQVVAGRKFITLS